MSTFLVLVTVASIAAAVLCAAIAWRTVADDRARAAARVAALSRAIHGNDDHPLFAGGARSSSRVPMIATAIGGAVTAVLVAFWAIPSRTPAAVAAPLELISMRHARDGAALTVMGIVRNPANGASVGRVSAVVSGFDATGTLVSTNRAPIDFLSLDPGDESNFAVSLPEADHVGRYRVTFRTERGMIRHVDRRSSPVALAGLSRNGVRHEP